MNDSKLKKDSIYCPHCGYKIVSFRNADGAIKTQCKKCKSVIYSVIIAFKLEDCETYIPAPSKASAAEKAAARLGHFPMAWKNAFGLPIEEHESQLKVDVLDDFARFEVVKPNPPTPPKSQQMTMDFGEGGSGDGIE